MTAHGVIKVSWAVEAGGAVKFNCTIPANTKATVTVPIARGENGGGRLAVARLDGRIFWSSQSTVDGTQRFLPLGVSKVVVRLHGLELQLGSGEYVFHTSTVLQLHE